MNSSGSRFLATNPIGFSQSARLERNKREQECFDKNGRVKDLFDTYTFPVATVSPDVQTVLSTADVVSLSPSDREVGIKSSIPEKMRSAWDSVCEFFSSLKTGFFNTFPCLDPDKYDGDYASLDDNGEVLGTHTQSELGLSTPSLKDRFVARISEMTMSEQKDVKYAEELLGENTSSSSEFVEFVDVGAKIRDIFSKMINALVGWISGTSELAEEAFGAPKTISQIATFDDLSRDVESSAAEEPKAAVGNAGGAAGQAVPTMKIGMEIKEASIASSAAPAADEESSPVAAQKAESAESKTTGNAQIDVMELINREVELLAQEIENENAERERQSRPFIKPKFENATLVSSETRAAAVVVEAVEEQANDAEAEKKVAEEKAALSRPFTTLTPNPFAKLGVIGGGAAARAAPEAKVAKANSEVDKAKAEAARAYIKMYCAAKYRRDNMSTRAAKQNTPAAQASDEVQEPQQPKADASEDSAAAVAKKTGAVNPSETQQGDLLGTVRKVAIGAGAAALAILYTRQQIAAGTVKTTTPARFATDLAIQLASDAKVVLATVATVSSSAKQALASAAVVTADVAKNAVSTGVQALRSVEPAAIVSRARSAASELANRMKVDPRKLGVRVYS